MVIGCFNAHFNSAVTLEVGDMFKVRVNENDLHLVRELDTSDFPSIPQRS